MDTETVKIVVNWLDGRIQALRRERDKHSFGSRDYFGLDCSYHSLLAVKEMLLEAHMLSREGETPDF